MSPGTVDPLDSLGPLGDQRAALEHAPPRWRPCLPHLRGLRELRLERWLERWAHQADGSIGLAVNGSFSPGN